MVCSFLFLFLQVLSDQEEDIGELNKENMWELSCETVREQLTNSIRKQWRMLKNHVEKLDNQGWCLTALCIRIKYILEKLMQMWHFEIIGCKIYVIPSREPCLATSSETSCGILKQTD